MALIQYTQGNLIGGVSQQPAALRAPGECTEMVNCLPSPVEGLTKRPPTILVKELGATPAVERYHTIYRDGVEQYLLRITPSGVSGVNLLTGAAITVSDPDAVGFGYLASVTDPHNIELTTVGDTTFVLNKGEVTSMDAASVSPTLDNKAILFLRQGDYSSSYKVKLKINGVQYATAETKTWKGTGSAAAGEINSVKTEDIMADLATKLTALGIPGFITVLQTGSLIEVTFSASVASVDYITTEDSVGDSVLSVIYEDVPRVEGWLPETCRDGFKIKIAGDAEIDTDQYYVVFETDGEEDGNIGKGKWEETVAPGVETQVDASTFPHILVSTAPNVFSWQRPTWADRVTGDADSNNDPSFIGKALNNFFFYKDRLGFITGQNVILSETGEYFNFFRTTLLTLRDSSVIDVETNHTKVTVFENAVAFNENIMLFSRRGQFILRGADILSPRTVQLIPVGEYESSVSATPEPTAKSVYFPYARGAQSGLRELFQTGDILTFDASDTTATIPNYIDGAITEIIGSTLENTVVSLTEQTDGLLYLYNYLWSGDQKVQGAWGKWLFPGDNVNVLHASFVENTLYIVIDRDGSLSLESVVVATGTTDPSLDFTVHLDRRVTEVDLTVAFDIPSLQTTFTFPYSINDSSESFGLVERLTGVEIPVFSQTANTVTVQGDFVTADVFGGVVYDMEYTFTVPLVKRSRNGSAALGQYTIPQTVRALYLQYAGTRSFDVEVTNGRRATKSFELPAVLPDAEDESLGSVDLHDGEFRVDISARAQDATVVIRNSTPYPSNIAAAIWEINYRERARRV